MAYLDTQKYEKRLNYFLQALISTIVENVKLDWQPAICCDSMLRCKKKVLFYSGLSVSNFFDILNQYTATSIV